MERTKDYITEPSKITDKDFPELLRKREPEKEIHHGMYFKSNTEMERLIETLQNNYGLANRKEDLKKLNELLGEKSVHFISRMAAENKKAKLGDIARNLRPELHKKTHFRAVLAMVNGSSQALLRDVDDIAAEEAKKSLDDTGDSIQADPANTVKLVKQVSAIPGSLPLISLRYVSSFNEKKIKKTAITGRIPGINNTIKIEDGSRNRSPSKELSENEKLMQFQRELQLQPQTTQKRKTSAEIEGEEEDLGKKVNL